VSERDGLIIGAVCARGGSKGIPRKNLRMLGGKPLIAHAIECARECPTLDRVVVSTDDEEIAQTARSYGAEVPFLRPASLAEDSTSKWPVFRHLVERYEELHGVRVEMLVDLDSGVPLRLPEDVEGCVRLLEQQKADVVVTGYLADRNPYFNMVERGPSGFMQTVKPANPPVVARQLAPPVFSLSPAVFAIRRPALWDYAHWSQAKLDLYEIPRDRAVDIDSEMDFLLVEYLMTQKEHANE
jgi:CMP-N,N'-diacetyllegionaminic acid synthase